MHFSFFFEKEWRFGGMRGFDIAKTLAGDDHSGIFLHSTVWDILQNKRIAVKDMLNHKNFYVEAQALIVATGAVPFMPTFENDDVPGVYTAAVVQKMMNAEFTLLGKNILTVGAGNIGYLTSYQLMQAGAKVKAILEAMPHEGGFPGYKRIRNSPPWHTYLYLSYAFESHSKPGSDRYHRRGCLRMRELQANPGNRESD